MQLLPSWKISLLVPPLLISDTFSRVVHCVVATFKTDYFLTSRVWIVFHLLTCTCSNKPTPTQPLVYNTVLFSVWAPAKNTKNNFLFLSFMLSFIASTIALTPSKLKFWFSALDWQVPTIMVVFFLSEIHLQIQLYFISCRIYFLLSVAFNVSLSLSHKHRLLQQTVITWLSTFGSQWEADRNRVKCGLLQPDSMFTSSSDSCHTRPVWRDLSEPCTVYCYSWPYVSRWEWHQSNRCGTKYRCQAAGFSRGGDINCSNCRKWLPDW